MATHFCPSPSPFPYRSLYCPKKLLPWQSPKCIYGGRMIDTDNIVSRSWCWFRDMDPTMFKTVVFIFISLVTTLIIITPCAEGRRSSGQMVEVEGGDHGFGESSLFIRRRKTQQQAAALFNSENTGPYISSPFSLPPFESLSPLSSPQTAPPFCFCPPPSSPEPPPSTPIFEGPPTYPPLPNPPTYQLPSPPKHAPRPPAFQPPVVLPPPSTPPPQQHKAPQYAVWCVAKPTVPDPIIQEAMDYACGKGADCESIKPDGSCFQPNTLFAHASYAFNSYWQRTKVAGGTCDFGGTAMLVTVNPSFEQCHFVYS